MHWPEKIKPKQVITEPVRITDLFPTFLSIAKTAKPMNYPLDGANIMPLVMKGKFKREFLCIHMPVYVPPYAHTPSSIIRMGDYKLIKFYGDYQEDPKEKVITAGAKIELYNLREDLSETHDLSKSMPEKAIEMENLLMNWLLRKTHMPRINQTTTKKEPPNPLLAKWILLEKSLTKTQNQKAKNRQIKPLLTPI